MLRTWPDSAIHSDSHGDQRENHDEQHDPFGHAITGCRHEYRTIHNDPHHNGTRGQTRRGFHSAQQWRVLTCHDHRTQYVKSLRWNHAIIIAIGKEYPGLSDLL